MVAALIPARGVGDAEPHGSRVIRDIHHIHRIARQNPRRRSLAGRVGQLVIPWLAVIAAGRSAQPQARPQRGVLAGAVTDTNLTPIEDADARILGSNIAVRTGKDGRFRIAGLPTGQYLIVIRRLGYSALSSFVEFDGADTVRASFMLIPSPLSLDTTVIQAHGVAVGLAEFDSRRKTGFGQFMTEIEIKKLHFVTTSDLLRSFASVAVSRRGVANLRGGSLGSCNYRIFVDGAAVAPRDLDADVPQPNELAGIEVHSNSATVPVQYATSGAAPGPQGGGGAMCGVILLWTKR